MAGIFFPSAQKLFACNSRVFVADRILPHSSGVQEDNHHVVITGGTGSLGRAIASGMRSSGATVDAPGSDELDVSDAEAVHRYFEHRPVDLLVCAAGIIRDTPLARLSEAMWDEVLAVNYCGSNECAKAVLPGMIQRGCGHIIFISSHSANHPPVGQVAYAAAKAALLGLVVDLAERHGPSGIRVNAVLPGFLETRMTEQVAAVRRQKILAAHTLARFNGCEETAAFICFLQHKLPNTSGQVFQLDSRTAAT